MKYRNTWNKLNNMNNSTESAGAWLRGCLSSQVHLEFPQNLLQFKTGRVGLPLWQTCHHWVHLVGKADSVYTAFTTEETCWRQLFRSGFHRNIPALWKLATKAESFQFSLISLSPPTKACATFGNRVLLSSFGEDTLVSMSVLFQESKLSLKSTTYMEVAYWLALEFSFNNLMVSGTTLSTHAVYFCLNSFKKYFYIVP